MKPQNNDKSQEKKNIIKNKTQSFKEIREISGGNRLSGGNIVGLFGMGKCQDSERDSNYFTRKWKRRNR